MGIKKFTDTCWRVYVVDASGKPHQKYFKTEPEAEAFYAEKMKGRIPTERHNKRSTAKAKDLPVGLCDTYETKINVHGEEVHHYKIVATCVVNGRIHHMQRSYGKIRPRAEAVRLCSNWRNQQMKEVRKCHKKKNT